MRLSSRLLAAAGLAIATNLLSGCCCVIPIPGPRPPLRPNGSAPERPSSPRPTDPVKVPRPVPI